MVRRILISALLVSLVVLPALGQGVPTSKIKVGEWIHLGDNTQLNPDKFIFLDFWATWCAPCLHSMPHVEQLMDAFGADVFFISMTQEAPIPVERHLAKKPIRTAVALDHESFSHHIFNVNAIPDALLINPTGRVIWRGHPSEMTTDLLRNKLRMHKRDQRVALTERIEIMKAPLKPVAAEPEDMNVLFTELDGTREATLRTQDQWITYRGNIYRLINMLFDLPLVQMQIDTNMAGRTYQVRVPQTVWKQYPSAVLLVALNRFGLKVEMRTVQSDNWTFTVEDEGKLWGADVIDWGKDSPGYMISDDQVDVDNRTVHAFCNILSEALGMPVVTDYRVASEHDWQVHIQFEDLMLEQLRTEFGVQMVRQESALPRLIVTSK